jgi:hypothetical protein
MCINSLAHFCDLQWVARYFEGDLSASFRQTDGVAAMSDDESDDGMTDANTPRECERFYCISTFQLV